MDDDKALEVPHAHLAVAVDADAPPGRRARDVKVCRQVDAALHARRDERVEPAERILVRL